MLRGIWILALAVPMFAGESAVLTSGMTLHVDRHEEADGTVRLYRGEAVIELSRTAISRFEADEALPPAPPPPARASQPESTPAVAGPGVAIFPGVAIHPDAQDPRAMVREAAARAGLPPAFVESVAKTESGFDPAAVSPKGAIGVMQLMPATAKALGADPGDPAQNIEAGARLLRELLIKYNGDVVKALAAYNAGEPAVDHYQGVPPYPETQHYVNTVVRDYIKSAGQ
jgi:soluble lytic murein transglycosylase-like protein